MKKYLKGKPVADAIKADVSARAASLKEKGVTPVLAVVRVGARLDDISYERRVLKNCDAVGITPKVEVLDENATQQEVEECVRSLSNDDKVHGILVFQPLPRHIDQSAIANVISPQKDIDCMNPENLKKVFLGDESAVKPCTPEAVIEVLKYYGFELSGANVVIVNRSLVVGKPLSMLFLNENSTVTICHSRTKNLPEITKKADIVVSGIGKPSFFGSNYFTKDSIIIDVGINFDENGKMCGDVDCAQVENMAAAITPVPGGVGSVTSAILLRHLIESAQG